MLDYKEIVSGPDLLEKKILKLKNSNLPTVLFGFGGMVFHIYDNLVAAGLNILYICDNNPKKQGLNFKDIDVISFEDLKLIYKDCNILISVCTAQFVKEITQQIKEDGQFQNVFFFEMFYPFGNGVYQTVNENFGKISAVYDMLADEYSKKVFLNKVNYLISKNRKYTESISQTDEYFPNDIFDISDHEYFVDMGSYDGADTLRLIDKLGSVTKAWCFEPDPDNFNLLKLNVKNYHNIICEQAAVWSTTKKLSFSASGTMGSGVYESGTTYVNGIAIDDYFRNEKVSFMKMDVEGAEIDALQGAAQTITTQIPKLAICVYHTIEHHWEIPLLIHQICPQYKLYMRHHNETGIETVCYATI